LSLQSQAGGPDATTWLRPASRIDGCRLPEPSGTHSQARCRAQSSFRILIERYDLDDQTAFNTLIKLSQSENAPLRMSRAG
jgi:hypothetical protein